LRFSYDEHPAKGKGLEIFESYVRFDDSLSIRDSSASGLALSLKGSRGVYGGGTSREGGNAFLEQIHINRGRIRRL
ncbi:MAG: hypothetical protein AAF692_11910, partial [Pseudomonadota bacterium]